MAQKSRGLGRALRRRSQREFLVVGLGRFGSSLARALIDSGHDVLAIDADMRTIERRAAELPHVVQLDSTNIEALREIGAEHFDTAIVCIGTDFESNLMTTVALRKLGVGHVITKVRTRTQKEILEQVGADEVILPEHEAGVRLAKRLSAVDVVDYIEIGGDVCAVEMNVPERYVGMTLAQADLRRKYGLTVIAIHRGEDVLLNPSADSQILADDELLIVGRIEDAERMSD